jgi:thiol-disulfide isomerase/thioredoxin
MDVPAPEAPIEIRSRWANAAWIACSIALVVLVVGTWLRMHDERASASLANAIIAGKRPTAPALPRTGIDGDGAPGLPAWYQHGAGAHPGAQVMVVNWWASWCGPCIEETPALRKLAHEYEGRVTVVGINPGYSDLESDARRFVRKYDVDFPVVRGTRSDRAAWGGMNMWPETFVVGTDGRLSAHIPGAVDIVELRAILDRELRTERS